MANQLQNLQFIDGEWVSRPVDVYQIMARARRQDTTKMPEAEKTSKPHIPRLGILSRSVFSSPYVKFILPANIRHKHLNDVVFVGEDAVHLKEVHNDGSLHHIASKEDFDGRILAARVFGESRKGEVNPEHGTPKRRQDVHAQRRSVSGGGDDALPSEIIALTLSSKALMFLWARQSSPGGVKLCHKTVRLPAGASRFDRPGSFLAVDPRCRTMAVAASEGQFVLYNTKTMNAWRDGLRFGYDDIPIVDERAFPIQGRVMFMEFLSPGVGKDDDHVILAFIIAHAGRLKMTCYDWDARYGLATVKARAERVAIDHGKWSSTKPVPSSSADHGVIMLRSLDDRIPTLLIPLSRSPDFMLVCDRHIATYTQVLSGTSDRSNVIIGDTILTPLRPGDGTSSPQWVQWRSAVRNANYKSESFYITREDGRVMYVEVSDDSKLPELSDAGQFPHPVDTAFTSVDVDLLPDILVAGGTTSDGSLSKLGDQRYSTGFEVTAVDRIPNWAPISDLTVTRLPGTRKPFERERDSIFVSSGRAPHGSVAELRRGIRAVINHDGEGMRGCTGLMVIDHGCYESTIDQRPAIHHYATMIANLPPECLLIRAIYADGNWYMEQVASESQESPNDVLNEITISAHPVSERFSVQVTHKEARTLSRPHLKQLDAYRFPSPLVLGSTLAGAKHIAAVYWVGVQAVLQILTINDDGTLHPLTDIAFAYEPTCLELMVIDAMPHVFVGLSDSSVSLLRIQSCGLQLMCDWNAKDIDLWTQAVCETAVALSSGSRTMIVCGSRSGSLICLSLDTSASGMSDFPVLLSCD